MIMIMKMIMIMIMIMITIMQKLQRDLRLDVSESSCLHYQGKKSVCERGYLNRLELKLNILMDG